MLESSDRAEIVSALSGILAPHDMAISGSGSRLHAKVRHVGLPRASLADIRYGAAVTISSQVPADRGLIHTVVEGESTICRADGVRIAMRTGAVHVSPPGTPVVIEFGGASRHLTASLATELCPHFDDGSAGVMKLNQVQARVWQDMMRLMLDWGELRQSGLPASAPDFEPLIACFFRVGAVSSDRSGLARQAGALPWFVVRARRIIAHRVHEGCDEVALIDVAREAGVAPRTLQAALRRFLGSTFSAMVREERLIRLDRLLAHPRPGADVTKLMQECGIVSMGRFAAYYRDRFGLFPSDRLRGSTH